jgi:hypothetical protein
MTKEEYARLPGCDICAFLLVNELQNKKPRCLLHGYTLERDTYDCYLNNSEILEIKITHFGNPIPIATYLPSNISDIIPSNIKRIYPKESDYEFCKLLQHHGIYISFTTF